MTLRLSVVSDQGIRLGTRSTKVFGVRGGSIGRGADNDWILPDPERYLSAKHARVEFQSGSYILVDTSSNGTYVNGRQVPLGKYHHHVLENGDHIQMGEYELLITIDNEHDLGADLELGNLLEQGTRLSAEAGMPAPNPAAEPPQAATPWHMMTRPIKPAQAGVTGAAPDEPAVAAAPPDAPLPDADPPNARARTAPTPAITKSTPVQRAASPAPAMAAKAAVTMAPPAAVQKAAAPAATMASSAAGQREATPAPAVAAKAAVQPATAVGDGVEGGLAAFCRGAGIDPMSIAPKARGAALQLAGQLLRESVSGLFDLTHSRAEFHARFSIEVPGEALDSPVNFSQGVDEALVSLLSNLSSVSGSPEAIRENFRELNAQNTASLAAMRVAFEAFLDRVDPEELLQRFESAAKRGVFGSPSKSRCWDLYTELFQGLAQRPAGGFPKLFADSFTTAYEAKMRTLIPPRRSSVGADRHESITTDEAAKGDP